jgi:coenzyme F420-0:L-glutamate ligase/coenzyme F420-1:gamma-L-glutamate ligase
MVKVEIVGLKMHVVEGPCNIVEEFLNAVKLQGVDVADGDVVVIIDKLVSKCLGRVVKVDDVKPSKRALRLARNTIFILLWITFCRSSHVVLLV